MRMGMCTKGCGKMTKLMGMVFTCMQMVQGMKENGKRINSTERVLRDGLTALSTMGNTLKVKSTVEVHSNGATTLCSLVNSRTTILKVMEPINGTMAENTMEIGRIIRCMGKVCLHGQTDENIQGHIKKT